MGRRSFLTGRFAWALVGFQIVLLGGLAALQYRWTGEVSRAERERMRAGLELLAERYASDFDRELTRIFVELVPDGPHDPSSTADRLARYRETAPFPELVRRVLLVDQANGEAAPQALDETTGTLSPAAWPAGLERLRRRLAASASPFGGRGPDVAPFLAPELPGLLLPTFAGGGGDTGGFRRPMRLPSLLIVELDRKFLTDDFLPRLGERHLTGTEPAPEFAVVDVTAGELIHASSPGIRPAANFDVEVPLFGFVGRDELHRLLGEARRLRPTNGGPPGRRLGRWGSRHLGLHLGSLFEGIGQTRAAWRLRVRHPEGSLEAAVARQRHRQLGVSFAVLLLLGASLSMLWISSRRAERLARQQVEFVAGVSHELRTPLAAIGSLGENLADGLIEKPEQVRHYGDTIRREGARLGRLVEQVLEFAGILSGRPPAAPEDVEITTLIDDAVADVRPLADEAGAEITVEVAVDLPHLLGDAAALRRALGNLLTNAMKYAGPEARIVVRARRRGGELELSVDDDGPGFDRDDLSHLFEPFYRGRPAVEGQIRGSGLGLALVHHTVGEHGGRVTATSSPEGGARILLRLPLRPVEARSREIRSGDSP